MSYIGLRKHLVTAAALTAAFFAVAQTAKAAPHRHHKHHAHRFVPDANGNQVRPAGCPSAWCGCWLMRHLGMSDKRLWRAIEWAHLFPRTHAHVGAVAVWRHHVGEIVGGSPGHWIILSGNDGHRVRRRERSVRGVVAFVNPNSMTASMN